MSTPLIPTVPVHAPVHFSMYPAVPGAPHMQAPIATVAASPPQQVVSSGSIRNCIRLRGMPYSATAEDILNFLGDLSYFILPNGVHMVLNQQGRPSGDAFIQLNSAERAAQAAQDVSKGGCHKRHMGERYVEVFQCSGDEMNMVLMGGTLNRNGIQPPPGMALIQEQLPLQNPAVAQSAAGALGAYPQPGSAAAGLPPTLMFPQQSMEYMYPQALLQSLSRQSAIYPPAAYIPYPALQGSPALAAQQVQLSNAATLQAIAAQQGTAAIPQQLLPAAGVQVRMQGVPYNTGVSDILTFFKGYNQPSAVLNGAVDGNQRAIEAGPSLANEDKSQLNGNPATSRPNEWTCIA